MDSMVQLVTLGVDCEALTESLEWCNHKRGRNWCAVIEGRDPQAPGGWKRSFLERGKGSFYYCLNGAVQAGVVLEFGGDYYTAGGRPQRSRSYAVVLERKPDALVLAKFETAAKARRAREQALAAYLQRNGDADTAAAVRREKAAALIADLTADERAELRALLAEGEVTGA